jgi:ABC-2 type transport system permease protein
MSRSQTLLLTYIHLAWQQWLASRAFIVTLVASQALTPLIGLAVWAEALPGHAVVSSYYVGLLFVQLLTVSYENHTFSSRIYDGQLADDLLRPHPVVFRPLGDNLAIRAWFIVVALPLILGILLLVPVHLSAAAAALALPAMLLAGFMRFLFTYTLALTAFWTERADSAVAFGQTLIFLLGGGAAPLALMPRPLHALVLALPFRAMYGFPAEVTAGWLDGRQVLLGYGAQLGWIAALAGASWLTWQSGIRRYSAIGG